MNKLQSLIQEMRQFGFTDEQLNEILEIADKEIVDAVIEDFAFNADRKVLDEYTQKFQQAKGNKEQTSQILNQIMTLKYGAENVETKKEEFLLKYLGNILELTKKTRETYKKYSQGDPEAIKAVEEAQKSPEIQKLAEDFKNEENPQDNG